ncbi:MAG: hypothetical protein ACR2KJ_10925 [Jatrophihabitans sp.]
MSRSEFGRSWSRSLPTVQAVIDLVQRHYGLAPTRVVLVRSFMNDVYRVDAGDRSYALKIYGIDRFGIDEVRWEQQLVRHVFDAGVPAAADVALLGGRSTAGHRAGCWTATRANGIHWPPRYWTAPAHRSN